MGVEPGTRDRKPGAGARYRTPFVGREDELATALRRLEEQDRLVREFVFPIRMIGPGIDVPSAAIILSRPSTV